MCLPRTQCLLNVNNSGLGGSSKVPKQPPLLHSLPSSPLSNLQSCEGNHLATQDLTGKCTLCKGLCYAFTSLSCCRGCGKAVLNGPMDVRQSIQAKGGVQQGSVLMCREFPGLLDDIRIWFRDYKKPDGKPENKFGFDDQWQNKEYTLKVSSAVCDTLLTRLLRPCNPLFSMQHLDPVSNHLSLRCSAPFASPSYHATACCWLHTPSLCNLT